MNIFVLFYQRIVVFAVVLIITVEAYHNYEGYKIIDILPRTAEHLQIVQAFQEQQLESVDFLITSKTVNRPVRLLLAPEQQDGVLQFFNEKSIPIEVINSNLTRSVAEQQHVGKRRTGGSDSIINFESYQRVDDINNYLDFLAAKYPQQVELKELGYSYEGRALKSVRISKAIGSDAKEAENEDERRVILIDAGLHAREWIAPATALYVIQQLVENATAYEAELQKFDWIIWPIANPDGYEYSHEQDRFWRKTRKPSDTATLKSCVGTDANRNFDFHWGIVGASDNICSEVYKGPRAFSEPETVALNQLLFDVQHECHLYLTLHSYGNYLLYPWGYTAALPSSWQYLDEVAQAAADAIQAATGSHYTVGSSTNVLYAAAGGSDDYALGVVNIPISITMELPAGGSGFDPAAHEIRPFVEESWLGIRAMAAKVAALDDVLLTLGGKSAANKIGDNVFWNLF